MQQIYLATSRLDAQRFHGFLAQHEIEAEIRESLMEATESCESGIDGQLKTSGFTVWVAEEQVTAAGELLSFFCAIVELTSEHQPPEDLSGNVAHAHEAQPARCRVPLLTALLCLACVIPSIGLWREPNPESLEAAACWGWRESQDVADGSYWAVLTTVFQHKSVEHLVMNLLGVVIFGWAIERSFGRGCWLALTFAAMLVSGTSELAIQGQLGVGASGLVYAYYGFTLAAAAKKRLMPRWLLIPLSIWLLYGVIVDSTSVLDHHVYGHPYRPWSTHAHLAGFGLGLLSALAFVISWKPFLTRTALASILVAACVPLNGSPWLSDWLIARGYRKYQQGNLQGAIDLYSQAINRADQPADAYLRRGEALLFDARLDEALADFDAALRCDAKLPNVRALRAVVFELRSDLKDAWEEANAEMENCENTAYGYAVRGWIAMARSDLETAASNFGATIKLEPAVASHWVNRAALYHEQCRFEDALADADHALWLDSLNATALFVRGLVRTDMTHHERARADIEQAISLKENELTLRPRLVWTHCQLAELHVALFELGHDAQRLDAARGHAERALQLAPNFWEAWRVRGSVEFSRKNFAVAERCFSRCLEFNARDASAECFLALCRHELGHSEDALQNVDRALALNPRFGYAYRSRGLILSAVKEHQKAIDDLTSALEFNPRFAEAYYLRGKARLADGDSAGGRADLRRAAELDSKYAADAELGK